MIKLTVLAVCILAASTLIAAQDGMPNQAREDETWAHSMEVKPVAGGAGRAGVSSRPFVTDLSYTTAAGATIALLTGLTSPTLPANYESTGGNLVPVISATNLCTPSMSGMGGTCYKRPNRISVAINCVDPVATGSPTQNLDVAGCTKYRDAVITIKINMNSFRDRVEWFYVNGKMEWHEYDDEIGILQFKLTPVNTHAYTMPSGSQCCTCNPPSNCDIPKADRDRTSLSFFVAVGGSRDGLDGAVDPKEVPQFQFAVFSTKHAWMGHLSLDADAARGNRLMHRLTGASKWADGTTVTQAEMTTFLPRKSLAKTFPKMVSEMVAASKMVGKMNGGTPKDGDMTFKAVGVGSFGSQGLLIQMKNIGFSVPEIAVSDPDGGHGMAAGQVVCTLAAVVCALVALML